MIKYATAIRVGTASTEAILRRFTRNASHPVYERRQPGDLPIIPHFIRPRMSEDRET
jgi:hypothetical protein